MGNRIQEILPLTGLGLGLLSVGLYWGSLPDVVPIHFNILGRADGFAPRAMLVMLPAIAIFLYVSLLIGQRYGKPNVPWRITDANRAQIEQLTRNLLYILRTETAWLLGYLQWALVQTALGKLDGLGVWFAPVFIGGIILPIAVFFVRGRQIAQQTG